MSLLDMAKRLVIADVRFVIIGGLAARAHGSARITEDLDICYDPDPVNVRRLAAVLADWNAYLRGIDPGLPFIMDVRTLQTSPVMTLTTDLGAIDVMDRVSGVGDFKKVLARSVIAKFEGLTLRVLDLNALIAAKRATGRPKDRDQLPELEALREMKKQQ